MRRTDRELVTAVSDDVGDSTPNGRGAGLPRLISLLVRVAAARLSQKCLQFRYPRFRRVAGGRFLREATLHLPPRLLLPPRRLDDVRYGEYDSAGNPVTN